MNSKILLLSIAVISVGLFAMPSTLSLFAGQHTFDKAGDTTICAKCHSDIRDELNANPTHKSLIGTGLDDCKGCHTSSRINATLIPKGISGTGNYTGTTYAGLDLANAKFVFANGTTNGTYNAYQNGSIHAAVTVECVWCHEGVGNFTQDAHDAFYANASTAGAYLKGANEACVSCHTKTPVSITWVYKGGFNATVDAYNNSVSFVFNASNVTKYTNNTG